MIEERIQPLAARVVELGGMQHSAITLITDLGATVQAAEEHQEAKNKAAEARIRALEAKNKEAEARVSALKGNIAIAIAANNQEAEERISALEAKNQEAEARIYALEGRTQEAEDDISALEAKTPSASSATVSSYVFGDEHHMHEDTTLEESGEAATLS